MECVILFRNPWNSVVGFVDGGEDDSNIAVFPNLDAAVEAAAHVPILRAAPYQIVELDEL